jgi:hypothetical protein
MARTRTWLATLGVAGLIALAVACGGGGGGDSNKVSESQAEEMADKFLFNMIGILTGDTDADDFLGMFAPECREGVEENDIEQLIALVSLFGGEELKDIKIQEFDVGDVNVEETEEGTLVSPKNLDNVRVKVDGKFVNANDYLQTVGFEDFGSSDPAEEPILMVRRDGKTYIADCTFLEDFAP